MVPRAIPVSVRTRLPVCSACWKRAERTGPDMPSSWALLEGPSNLAHHLALTQHRRLEPRGDGEEVGGDVVVEADGGAGRQLVGRDPGVLGQHLVDLGHRIVEAVHHGVDLGAQAGREHHASPGGCGGA